MGFFDFLKRKNKKEKNKNNTEIENYLKKLKISEIGTFIEDRLNENRKKEEEIFNSLNQKREVFINEIEAKLKTLNEISLDSKKADLKVKFIVEENKNRYIQQVEKLLDKLTNFESKELREFMREIDGIFLNFYNKSHLNYEKATILIGKEIAEIRNLIKNFSKNLIKTFDENLIKEIENLLDIQLKLEKIEKFNSELKVIDESIISLNKNIDENKEKKEKLFKKIDEIKKSEGYNENLKIQMKLKNLQEELENLILDLKQKIDFKELANFFHIFPENIKVVKEYKENFLKKFKQNKENILSLINEANLKNSVISEKLEKIEEKEKEIQENKQKIQEDETLFCYDSIKELDLNIETIERAKEEKEKKKNKLENNKKNLIDFLKLKLKEFNIELI
jgi:hypothetical protein